MDTDQYIASTKVRGEGRRSTESKRGGVLLQNNNNRHTDEHTSQTEVHTRGDVGEKSQINSRVVHKNSRSQRRDDLVSTKNNPNFAKRPQPNPKRVHGRPNTAKDSEQFRNSRERTRSSVAYGGKRPHTSGFRTPPPPPSFTVPHLRLPVFKGATDELEHIGCLTCVEVCAFAALVGLPESVISRFEAEKADGEVIEAMMNCSGDVRELQEYLADLGIRKIHHIKVQHILLDLVKCNGRINVHDVACEALFRFFCHHDRSAIEHNHINNDNERVKDVGTVSGQENSASSGKKNVDSLKFNVGGALDFLGDAIVSNLSLDLDRLQSFLTRMVGLHSRSTTREFEWLKDKIMPHKIFLNDDTESNGNKSSHVQECISRWLNRLQAHHEWHEHLRIIHKERSYALRHLAQFHHKSSRPTSNLNRKQKAPPPPRDRPPPRTKRHGFVG